MRWIHSTEAASLLTDRTRVFAPSHPCCAPRLPLPAEQGAQGSQCNSVDSYADGRKCANGSEGISGEEVGAPAAGGSCFKG